MDKKDMLFTEEELIILNCALEREKEICAKEDVKTHHQYNLVSIVNSINYKINTLQNQRTVQASDIGLER